MELASVWVWGGVGGGGSLGFRAFIIHLLYFY